MRVPLILLFVGWWMAGQSWMATGKYYREPSISVSPEVVTLGGNVTVRCGDASHPHAEFSLFKGDPSLTRVLSQKARDYEAEFIISNTRISDAGIYRCLYYFKLDIGNQWSHYSDEVCIKVTDPGLPKPSIKVRPKAQREVGMKVTIECEGPRNGLTFSLHKSKNLSALQTKKAKGNTSKFSLTPLRPEDAGNYTCQYYRGENPFVSSKPSDHIQLVVTVFPSIEIIARLGVAGFVLLALGLIVAEAAYSWRKGQL